MYTGLLHTHSMLRYLVLVFLLVVIVTSLAGWLGKKPYKKLDNKLSLYLFISTHLQLLVGLILYFVSPWVKFSEMSNRDFRYWTVEHVSMMLIAVVLITLGRTTSKKMTDDTAKHKRLFLFNLIALVIVVVAIVMSKRGLI
jgi:Na+-driven multidrug efflux pump